MVDARYSSRPRSSWPGLVVGVMPRPGGSSVKGGLRAAGVRTMLGAHESRGRVSRTVRTCMSTCPGMGVGRGPSSRPFCPSSCICGAQPPAPLLLVSMLGVWIPQGHWQLFPQLAPRGRQYLPGVPGRMRQPAERPGGRPESERGRCPPRPLAGQCEPRSNRHTRAGAQGRHLCCSLQPPRPLPQ